MEVDVFHDQFSFQKKNVVLKDIVPNHSTMTYGCGLNSRNAAHHVTKKEPQFICNFNHLPKVMLVPLTTWFTSISYISQTANQYFHEVNKCVPSTFLKKVE